MTTENTSEEDTRQDNTEVRSAVSDMDTDPANNIKIVRNDSISSDIPDLPPPLPTSPLPDDEDEVDRSRDSHSQESIIHGSSPARNSIVMPATERLIGGGHVASTSAASSAVKSMTVET